MKKAILNKIKNIFSRKHKFEKQNKYFLNKYEFEKQKILIGKLLSENVKYKNINTLFDAEFSVFSQFGDDGIIQWLINNLDIPNKTFIEFGVEDYRESNTRFLMINDNWSGFIMDGSRNNIDKIKKSEYFWKYDLQAKSVFITKENINFHLQSVGFDQEVGILHIDLDGNDYWIWKEINVIKPIILILEYNSVFGFDRFISVPYKDDFRRNKAHYSNLYFGASLPALYNLSVHKGYTFIGSNSAGNNAYFIRNDKMNGKIKELTIKEGYVKSKFRESRDENGNLSFYSGVNRLSILNGMPVYNVLRDEIEYI